MRTQLDACWTEFGVRHEMPPNGYVSQGRPARGAGEVLGRVRKIEGLVGLSGRAKALRIAVVAALTLLVALPAGASAASTAEVVEQRQRPVPAWSTATPPTTRSRSTLSARHLHRSRTPPASPRRHRLHPGRDRRDLSAAGHHSGRHQRRTAAGTRSAAARGRTASTAVPARTTSTAATATTSSTAAAGASTPTCALDTPPFRCFDDVNGGRRGREFRLGHRSPTQTAPAASPPTCARSLRLANDDDGTVDGLNSIEGVVGGLGERRAHRRPRTGLLQRRPGQRAGRDLRRPRQGHGRLLRQDGAA